VTQLESLTALGLDGNAITANGLRALTSLPHLQELRIPFAIPLNDPVVTELKARFPGIKINHFPLGTVTL
jgi:hypothetical protein